MLNLAEPRHRAPGLARQPAQRGAILIVSLIVLVAMTLAGIGLMRSVSTGNRVAGNLAFQQAATQSADVGIEAAIAWLEANNAGATLYDHSAAGLGYRAARDDPAPNASWEKFWEPVKATSSGVRQLGVDASGNRVAYVIHRLCNGTGNPSSGIGCAVAPATVGAEGGSKGSNVPLIKLPSQQYYRITARVEGPRNTVSFVQVVVAM